MLRDTTQQNSKIIKISPFPLFSGQDKCSTKISIGRIFYLRRIGKWERSDPGTHLLLRGGHLWEGSPCLSALTAVFPLFAGISDWMVALSVLHISRCAFSTLLWPRVTSPVLNMPQCLQTREGLWCQTPSAFNVCSLWEGSFWGINVSGGLSNQGGHPLP